MKTYIKLMPGLPLSSASRNKREMAAAQEAGYRVVAIFFEPDYVTEAELTGVELEAYLRRMDPAWPSASCQLPRRHKLP